MFSTWSALLRRRCRPWRGVGHPPIGEVDVLRPPDHDRWRAFTACDCSRNPSLRGRPRSARLRRAARPLAPCAILLGRRLSSPATWTPDVRRLHPGAEGAARGAARLLREAGHSGVALPLHGLETSPLHKQLIRQMAGRLARRRLAGRVRRPGAHRDRAIDLVRGGAPRGRADPVRHAEHVGPCLMAAGNDAQKQKFLRGSSRRDPLRDRLFRADAGTTSRR